MCSPVLVKFSHCTICQTYQSAQAREDLEPHEFLSRQIAADLFLVGHQTFLIMVDYWSNFFKAVEIHRKTARAVVTQFKVRFARHGILLVLISDNGPEFDNTTAQSLFCPVFQKYLSG